MDKLFFHKSVLVDEVLTYLNVKAGKTYLDVTFGSGGHTRAILMQDPTCKVIAVDWDKKSLETYSPQFEEEFKDRVHFIWGNFAHLYHLLKKAKITKVDGIIADFGTSQMQIFDRAGFSFNKNTPLDMRMSPSHQLATAEQIVNTASQEELAEIFFRYGEEPQSRRIARKIVESRKIKRIRTTKDLALLIESIISPAGKRIHPATRVFQALRICVNKEMENIESFLAYAPRILTPGSRLVCISFHSLEDRLVKQYFQDQERLGYMKTITKRVVVASQEEIKQNPSSRSARLRAGELVLSPLK